MNNILKIFFFTFLTLFCTATFAQKKGSKKNKKAATTQTTKSSKNKKVSSKKTKQKDDDGNGDDNNIQQETQVGGGNAAISKDTSKPGVVTITSSFKPNLRTAAKINFNATTPELDTTKLTLNYNIPAQNLFFSYQPVAIKPLSLSADSSFEWQNHQYVKAGFGNYSTPYLETGLSFGNPNTTLLSINANYVSSKGSIAFQEFTKATFKASASFGAIANHELIASIGYNLSSQYKYGTSAIYNFKKEDLQQTFNSIDVAATLQNKLPTSFGISYKPQLSVNLFFDNNKATENTIAFNAPVTKNINDNLSFTATANADISSYKKDSLKLTNNIFSISPTLAFNNKIFSISVGAKPSWNNSEFAFLPNVNAFYKLANEKFILTAGWLGYFNKNTYKNLAYFNPYIEQPTSFKNTKVTEQYIGIKGGIGKHVSFNSQVSFLKYVNQALFVNDDVLLNTQTFKTLYEPKLNAVRISAELSYTDKEKISFLTSLSYTQFTSQDSFPKAYGIIPLQLNATVKYKVLKDVFVKGDLFFNDGNYYKVQTIQTDKTNTTFDMNIGAEYKVLNKLNVYIDFNNLFNNQYQRWHQYQVLGFNIVAGVVYSFR